MALAAGTRLGPYEILAPIGAGGMGEVYRARDTRLDRTVAIKVLPPDSADHPERQARFEREARAISALAHPNICTLHDIGRENGKTYLVMEHLEGQTLARRLERGALPLEECLEIAAQIADGLSAAHKQGIVHRDLKPGNVILTKTGAKLLDFGLARLAGPIEEPAAESVVTAPTEPEPLTGAGTILGTLPYMAPEQVRGEDVDPRTDLWALGTILYEMVGGQRPFRGEGRAVLMSAILEREPSPISELAPALPPHLGRVVMRCLAKDRDARWQSAADIAAELRWISEGPVTPVDEAYHPAEHRSWRQRLPWALALLAAVATGVATFSLWRPTTREGEPVAHASIVLPPGLHLPRVGNTVALAPDGSLLAYVAEPEGGRTQLYLRALDRLEPTPLPETEGAASPFFSPDGRWIGFFADGELKKVAVTGGAAVTLSEAPGWGKGGSWGPNDTIVFSAQSNRDIRRVASSGGATQLVVSPDLTKGESACFWPDLLPGGKAVLYSLASSEETSWDDARIALRSLETGEQTIVIEGGSGPRYSPSGHIFYSRAGTLRAIRFDLERLEVSGPSFEVLPTVRTNQTGGEPDFAVARDGTLVYVPGGPQPDRSLVWVDRQGIRSPITQEKRSYLGAALSPDGRHVALMIGWRDHHVWSYDLQRGALDRLTHRWDQHNLCWSPDGQRLLFQSTESNPPGIFWVAPDGGRKPERLLPADREQYPSSISSDGKVLALAQRNPSTGWDILLYTMDDESRPREFLATGFNEGRPQFSPDDRWVAYQSDRTGRREVYVTSFPGRAETVVVSREGGGRPRWAANGRELFFRSGGRVMVADIETEPMLIVGQPRAVFPDPSIGGPLAASADGQRFVMIERPETKPVTRMNVVFSFFDALAARTLEAGE